MPQRNNPMSAVQKKRTVSTTKRKGTTSSSKTSRTSKKEQVKHRTVMPTWLRNILAVMIVGCFSVAFYYFFIRPYAYRWKPCHGLKEYGVCIPDGYDIHGIDISHYQGKIDWKKLLQNKETATPLHFVFMKAKRSIILSTSILTVFLTRYGRMVTVSLLPSIQAMALTSLSVGRVQVRLVNQPLHQSLQTQRSL